MKKRDPLEAARSFAKTWANGLRRDGMSFLYDDAASTHDSLRKIADAAKALSDALDEAPAAAWTQIGLRGYSPRKGMKPASTPQEMLILMSNLSQKEDALIDKVRTLAARAEPAAKKPRRGSNRTTFRDLVVRELPWIYESFTGLKPVRSRWEEWQELPFVDFVNDVLKDLELEQLSVRHIRRILQDID